MGLRETAEEDLAVLMEDSDCGFSWPIIVKSPAGLTDTLNGLSDDIAEMINVETGEAVSGRIVSVALRLSTLTAKGFTIPRGIIDSSILPWLISFDDLQGNTLNFKVIQSNPDRTIGLVVLKLEFYKL